jgi:radical SAM superfamily enzyme YgiQ (UPF0313 family)
MPLKVGLLQLPCLMARGTLSYFEGAPPLGLAYVAAAAREADHDIFVLDALGEGTDRYSFFPSSKGDLLVQGLSTDEIVERLPADLDVLGIGNLFLHELRFLQNLLPRLRARLPQAALILGGENASGMSEDVLEIITEVTGCITGEGEEAFVALLEVLEKGEGLETAPSLTYRVDGVPRRNARAPRVRDIDQLPWPAWDLFPVQKYLEAGIRSGVNRGRSMPILTSRGCPYTCAFCSSPEMWGTSYVSRSPARVVDEIESLIRRYGITNVDLRDLTAMLKKSWIRAFHAEVKSRNVEFTWQIPQGMRSEVLDAETLRLLHETGCRNLGYALESVSAPIITRMRKKVVPERLMRSVREAVDLHIRLDVFFIIGYPGETVWDHLAYLRSIVRLAVMGVDAVSVMQFNPYPGSSDYFGFRKDGKIDFGDDNYVYSSLFRTLGQNPSTRSAFSDRYLNAFLLVCQLSFWGLQFLVRPWRLLRSAWNVLRSREETVLDQFLVVKMRQWLGLGRNRVRQRYDRPTLVRRPAPPSVAKT